MLRLSAQLQRVLFGEMGSGYFSLILSAFSFFTPVVLLFLTIIKRNDKEQLTIWNRFMPPISQGTHDETSPKFSLGNEFSK